MATKNKLNKIKKNVLLIDEEQLSNTKDIQQLFDNIHKKASPNLRLFIKKRATFWKSKSNWIDEDDIKGFLKLSSFEVITTNSTHIIARPIRVSDKKYSVSIIVPARNEEGNVKKIPASIPKFGKWQEIIFVEGNSKDNTWDAINEVKNKYKGSIKIYGYKQKGRGKADAVRLGFKHAKGDILMIYDADRTVAAQDLKKFYYALSSNKGEFINGCRLIYPMEKDAMRTLNKLGNKLFGILFTFVLGQRFKDTLCGTKVFFKSDYLKFKKFKDDPFGDFELIFGAIENNLKVIEIPVRYKERVYGSTNINRFRHGLLLFKMTWLAFKKFKIAKKNNVLK